MAAFEKKMNNNIYQFDAEIFNDGWSEDGESYYAGQGRNGHDSIY